jgi:hypothetical protein
MILLASLLLFAATDRDLALTDPVELMDLETRGFDVGRAAFPLTRSPGSDTTKAALAPPTSADLARDPGYRDLVAALEADFRNLYDKDRAYGMGMRFTHRGFDKRWLVSPQTRWELAAVVNRVDRRVFNPGTCGEIRLVYRLAYATRTQSGPFASRLPATLNVVHLLEDDGMGCAEAAAILRGPLKDSLPGRLKSVEVNVQSVRWPSTVRPDLGGHAEYVLRVFHREGRRLVAAPLENTPDVDRLRRNPALRKDLLAWLRDHVAAVEEGTALLPERFLDRRAVSVTPRGLARPQNRPWKRLFAEAELKELTPEPAALLRRLDGLTCMGCHQSRSLAGFHGVGLERDPSRAVDALAMGFSPHFEEDLPRRRAYIASLLAGKAPAEARRHAERQTDRGGFGDACGLTPAFAEWTCAAGFACMPVDEKEVGQCMPVVAFPEGPSGGGTRPGGASAETRGATYLLGPGSACREGEVDFRRDRIARSSERECAGRSVCEGIGVGFPGGMCATSCADPGPGGVCGGIALLQPFNDCLARGGLFTDCARHARPAGLRACGEGNPCRPDYLCAKTASGEGACLPPYFVLQMRVDGHPPLR